MSLAASRINLLPTARTLASGAPFAGRINRNLPPAAHDHHDGAGPRTDLPSKWAFTANGRSAVTHINGELGSGVGYADVSQE